MTDDVFQFPKVGQCYELLEDVLIADVSARGYYWLRIASGETPYPPTGRINPNAGTPTSYTIPEGTVMKLINFKANSQDSFTSWWVLWSPDKKLMPKSRGGTGRRTHLWPSITDVNNQRWRVKEVA